MPLAWLLTGIWVVIGILAGHFVDKPDWIVAVAYPSFYVTFAMWPIYVAWVVLSRRLNLREKLLWLILVTLMNMVGMAMFFIFMLRRYLGIEGRTSPRDEAALDSFLRRCNVDRQELSPGQLDLLRSNCRGRRLAKWAALPMLLVAALMLYEAVVFIPRDLAGGFSGLIPTHLVVIDSAKGTKKEYKPDDETEKMFVKLYLTFGAAAGVMGTCGIVFLFNFALLFFGNGNRKLIVDFLKVRRRR